MCSEKMKYRIVNSITSNTVCGGPSRRRFSEAISFARSGEEASGWDSATVIMRESIRIIEAAVAFSAR